MVEADFFDWIVDVLGGERFIKRRARRLSRFAWEHVAHDVDEGALRVRRQSHTRHLLGGYYTPDCLAEEIIDNGVTDPLTQRVLERELR